MAYLHHAAIQLVAFQPINGTCCITAQSEANEGTAAWWNQLRHTTPTINSTSRCYQLHYNTPSTTHTFCYQHSSYKIRLQMLTTRLLLVS